MKFKIDYTYPISVVPYRCQNARTASSVASIEVEVREVSSADAPVAMLVRNPADYGNHAFVVGDHARRFVALPDGGPREVRAFDGRLFVDSGMSAADFEKAVNDDVANSFFKRAKPREGEDKVTTMERFVRGLQRSHPGPVVKMKDDGGRKKGELIERLASLAIVVDGRVFEFTPEPVLLCDERGNPKIIIPRPSPERFSYDELNFFPYDYRDLKLALKHAESTSVEDGDLFFEVLRPEYSRYDGVTPSILHYAESIVEAGKDAAYWPRDLLEIFYDVRDSYLTCGESVTPRLVEALSRLSNHEFDQRHEEEAAAFALWYGVSEAQKAGSFHDEMVDQRLKRGSQSAFESTLRKAVDAVTVWNLRAPEAYWEHLAGHVSHYRKGFVEVSEVLSEGRLCDAAALSGASYDEMREGVSAGWTPVRVRTMIADSGDHHACALVSPDGEVRVPAGTVLADAALEVVREFAAIRVPPPDYGETVSLQRFL